LLAAAFPSQPLHAQADPAIIHKVDTHYNHLTSLRAHFTERYSGMGMDRTESGTLLLRKPGLMRWNYDRPTGKVFVLDGKFGWFYSPGDAQALRTPVKQLDDLRSPLRFLLGHTELAKELDQLKTAPTGTGFRITGIPKGMADRVSLLTLDISATGAIEHMKLEESGGATTEFSFTNIEEDIPLKPTDLAFTPPPGVAVIDGLPPI
jgi:outer membrane lipoprotein carrier protein